MQTKWFFSSFTLNVYLVIGWDHGILFRFAGLIFRSVASASIFPLVFGQAGRASGRGPLDRSAARGGVLIGRRSNRLGRPVARKYGFSTVVRRRSVEMATEMTVNLEVVQEYDRRSPRIVVIGVGGAETLRVLRHSVPSRSRGGAILLRRLCRPFSAPLAITGPAVLCPAQRPGGPHERKMDYHRGLARGQLHFRQQRNGQIDLVVGPHRTEALRDAAHGEQRRALGHISLTWACSRRPRRGSCRT